MLFYSGLIVHFRRLLLSKRYSIQVDGFELEGRMVRASFGTTKYCNAFLRHAPCTNPDCLYLHTLGDDEVSHYSTIT